MKKILCFVLIYIFNCLPIKKNKIFLFSYYGSQYGCNPKYVTDYILAHYPTNRFDMVWAFNDPEAITIEGFRKVKTMSLRYFYELSTSKVIITNFRTTSLFVKRKDQYYIQTWHSSLRLKQIEKDAEDSLPAHYVTMAKKDSAKCDLLLSGCTYSTEIFKRSFWYGGEIFEYGIPRNDLLVQNRSSHRNDIKNKLAIPPRRKVVLYAPTFRENNHLSVYDLDYRQLSNRLKHKFGGDWLVLVKFHPHLISESKQLLAEDNVIDVTSYHDIQELLLVADVLVSDYSSLMFDFSITKRPCFLYVPDINEYTSKERKLYVDLNELPFVTATSNKELAKKIDNFHYRHYQDEVTKFLKQIGSFEQGVASKKLLERIDGVCYSEKRGEVVEAV